MVLGCELKEWKVNFVENSVRVYQNLLIFLGADAKMGTNLRQALCTEIIKDN